MTDDQMLTGLLAELDSIANAAMTAREREMRAEPVIQSAGVTVQQIIEAVHRTDFPWNGSKARAFGVSVETWIAALDVICDPPPETTGELLVCIHRSETALAMLRAGYRPSRNASGKLSWARPAG